MSVDLATVQRVAGLARIALEEAEAERTVEEFNSILNFVEQLSEVDVTEVEPMASAIELGLPLREDAINDGERPGEVVGNAPVSEDGFFMVPKVIE